MKRQLTIFRVNKGKVENLESRMAAVKEEYEANSAEQLEKIRGLEAERYRLLVSKVLSSIDQSLRL